MRPAVLLAADTAERASRWFVQLGPRYRGLVVPSYLLAVDTLDANQADLVAAIVHVRWSSGYACRLIGDLATRAPGAARIIFGVHPRDSVSPEYHSVRTPRGGEALWPELARELVDEAIGVAPRHRLDILRPGRPYAPPPPPPRIEELPDDVAAQLARLAALLDGPPGSRQEAWRARESRHLAIDPAQAAFPAPPVAATRPPAPAPAAELAELQPQVVVAGDSLASALEDVTAQARQLLSGRDVTVRVEPPGSIRGLWRAEALARLAARARAAAPAPRSEPTPTAEEIEPPAPELRLRLESTVLEPDPPEVDAPRPRPSTKCQRSRGEQPPVEARAAEQRRREAKRADAAHTRRIAEAERAEERAARHEESAWRRARRTELAAERQAIILERRQAHAEAKRQRQADRQRRAEEKAARRAQAQRVRQARVEHAEARAAVLARPDVDRAAPLPAAARATGVLGELTPPTIATGQRPQAFDPSGEFSAPAPWEVDMLAEQNAEREARLEAERAARHAELVERVERAQRDTAEPREPRTGNDCEFCHTHEASARARLRGSDGTISRRLLCATCLCVVIEQRRLVRDRRR